MSMSTPQTHPDSNQSDQSYPPVMTSTKRKTAVVQYDELFTKEDEQTVVYKITKVMAHHPIKIYSCMFFFILTVVVITMVSGVANVSESTEYDWVIADTDESRNLDAFDDAVSRVDPLTVTVTERSFVTEDKFYFVYQSKDGSDIYTPTNILQMCETESLMVTTPGFDEVCRLSGGNCSAPSLSIVSFFYGFALANNWNCTMLTDTQVNLKKQVIYNALLTPAGQQRFGIWLSKDSVDLGYSTLCNSIWDFGSPLAGYESENDREDEQFEEYQDFVSTLDGTVGGVEAVLFDHFDISYSDRGLFPYYPSPYMNSARTDSLNVRWLSAWTLRSELSRLLTSDLNFAILSVMFVVVWLRVHTKSTLLALSAIYMIVMSVPFTILIYKKVFNIPYYSELHSLVLFIVLGVGADDVFVLADSWKLAKHNYPEDITNGRNVELVHRRLLKCYRHTMSTVFNTSFTTSMAFLATGLSPLMPISTFGWYAASCIVVNYIFVITFMPPAVILAEMYFENSCIPCQEKKSVDEVPVATAENDGATEKYDVKTNCETFPNDGGLELTLHEQNCIEEDKISDHTDMAQACANSAAPSLSSRLLESYISVVEWRVSFRDVEIRVVALTLVIGLLAFGIVGVVYGIQLQPPTTQESWLRHNHMTAVTRKMITEDFLGVDEAAYADISITLGISGIDRSDFNVFIPGKNRGTAKFDDHFNLAAPSCQKVFVRMCEDIPTAICDANSCEPTNLLSRTDATQCFMADFRTWAQAEYAVDTYNMNETYFYDRLSEFRKDESWQDEVGFIDGEVKFATVSFVSTMENREPMASKIEVQDAIEALLRQIAGYDECDECGCGSLMYTSPFAFVWLRSEIGLVRGFYQGMFIAFPVAFCVLLVSTGNYLIAFYAILSVLFIVFGVLGFANYGLGWNLGIAESIAGIIIIGFSVDYTVHLGHMFTEGEAQLGYRDRKSKFEFASREIVPTVVGGAITTAGAGAFMFFCQLQFFVKMAALIVCTIVLSYMYSLGFFMSVLLVVGPENDQGKVEPIIEWVKAKMSSEKDATKVDAEKVSTKEDKIDA